MEETDKTMTYPKLLGVLAALLGLTAVTVLASRIDLGNLNVVLALSIASAKAAFVTLFFMHLKYESRFLKLAFIMTLVFLSIMIGFIFWDVAFR
ncbi:Cytochrome c oxidase subunit 4 [Candidatus Desulfarcum epimagneticum]|uniref:Cytochrome c oxidase subunit 4 n=1 Tax=uncultured Desulfobacteraceae bacterium TaxID=218296 RepID=A0A484HJY6_9BACT|nr:Cytochrome c oxidase subunit 4 [uncultured Desulfobacteraceae bacterium]